MVWNFGKAHQPLRYLNIWDQEMPLPETHSSPTPSATPLSHSPYIQSTNKFFQV